MTAMLSGKWEETKKRSKKALVWNDDSDRSFQGMKQALLSESGSAPGGSRQRVRPAHRRSPLSDQRSTKVFKGKSVSLFRKLRKWRSDLFWGLNIMPNMVRKLFRCVRHLQNSVWGP